MNSNLWNHFRNQGNKREKIILEGDLNTHHEDQGEFYPEIPTLDGGEINTEVLQAVSDWLHETEYVWGSDRRFGRVRITIEPLHDNVS